jgi:hypothetical protein
LGSGFLPMQVVMYINLRIITITDFRHSDRY